MFNTGIRSYDKKVIADVDGTSPIILQIENNFYRENNAYNSALGIYFADVEWNIIPNSAICLYTNTLGPWEKENVSVDVPAGARYMLYWLSPNGASYHEYSREETLDIRINGTIPHLYLGDRILPSDAYANMIHTSNPGHNYDNSVWMVLDNDGIVYMEDVEIGSQVDIGVIWTPIPTLCDMICTDNKVNVVEDIPAPTTQQITDIHRIIPRDGEAEYGPAEVFISEESSPIMTLADNGELWVTFLMEGAGYRNKFGYAIIDNEKLLAGEPKSKCIIKKVTIWANASALHSGGDLVTGDTVSLGTFPAGTTIVWWLTADGYNRPDNFTWWSVDHWNIDGFRHIGIGADPYSGKVVVGFEDLWGLGDKDYNDLVFYVTGHPITTIDYSKIFIGNPETDKTDIPLEWSDSVINFDGEGQIVLNEALYEERIKGN